MICFTCSTFSWRAFQWKLFVCLGLLRFYLPMNDCLLLTANRCRFFPHSIVTLTRQILPHYDCIFWRRSLLLFNRSARWMCLCLRTAAMHTRKGEQSIKIVHRNWFIPTPRHFDESQIVAAGWKSQMRLFRTQILFHRWVENRDQRATNW